ncbi:biotin-dependent carboxyltransferase family protein [Actinoplanes sp. TBRC 11911]|uniref:5-oxoprolinase subunit C family protein n=1 Tax=Actinoplanes sp. TBRC 11911 TaxID=2729386 RepID=UPI00145D352B|nr:biotin-dependent carboxyltransferase family protein [Actinoplanes sp. TBRC 11911]NMO49614.1 biotin-dependent carboxyltransferase family protein [Actinoplanes sp. TBRC 11911]
MRILRTGPLTVLKDAGRLGHAHQGVPRSGAVDREAYGRANALVGNQPGAAVLECTLGGLRVVFDEPALAVLTGTDAVLTVDGEPTGVEQVVSVPAGATVAVTMPKLGLRSYLAVRGGFDVPPVLGSRSTDRIGRVGPPQPAAGDILPIGTPLGAPTAGDATRREGPLEVDLGPRDDWFTPAAVETFLSAEYVVLPASDSVGVRLDGPALARARPEELPTEGVVRGSVQVPPDGRPILFQSDHPVTGGYPVIAVLTPESADRAAQLRPGARVRFIEAF